MPKQLTPLQIASLHKGLIIVYFEMPACIRVGLIHSTIKQSRLSSCGLLVEFDLLYADRDMSTGASQKIWEEYFISNPQRPKHSGVFAWPKNIMRLTFRKSAQLLSDRPGHLYHVKLSVNQW